MGMIATFILCAFHHNFRNWKHPQDDGQEAVYVLQEIMTEM